MSYTGPNNHLRVANKLTDPQFLIGGSQYIRGRQAGIYR